MIWAESKLYDRGDDMESIVATQRVETRRTLRDATDQRAEKKEELKAAEARVRGIRRPPYSRERERRRLFPPEQIENIWLSCACPELF